MTKNSVRQYRPSLHRWTPEERTEVPRVATRLVGDRLVYPKRGRIPEYVVPPEELAIRETLELDLRDGHAVASFVNAYGMVRDAVEYDGWETYLESVPLARVRDSLHGAATLARHVVNRSLGRDVTELWSNELGEPVPDQHCDSYFVQSLNPTLVYTQVRLQLHAPGIEHPLDLPSPDLIDVMSLQLLKVIEAELPIRECANETCPNAFQLQRGTAQHGQYRTKGTKYCQRKCAKVQIQRESRRKKRKEASR